MSRFVTLLLPAAALVIGALLFLLSREHGKLAEAREKLAVTTTENHRLENLQHELTAAKRKSEAVKPVVSPTTPGAASTPSSPRVLSETERRVRAQLYEYNRWIALAQKSDLIAALNLPPEKLAPFKDLLVERDDADRDARAAAKSADVNPEEAAAAEKKKIDERIRTLLGDADYDRFVAAQGIEFFRHDLEKSPILGALVDAGMSLTSDQTNALAGIYYKMFLTPAATVAFDQVPDPVTGLRPFQQTIIDQAREFLPAGKLDALREIFRKDSELGANMKAMSGERGSSR